MFNIKLSLLEFITLDFIIFYVVKLYYLL